MKPKKIELVTNDAALNIALDTIKNDKQALVFVNSKRSAEKTAEEIGKKIKDIKQEHVALSQQILKVLSSPTKQCRRLAGCVAKGTAFHHAGLTHKQRELIEDAFRDGRIKIISSTPTLCISKDCKIWQGIRETEVRNFKHSHPLFVLSKNTLNPMKAQKVQRMENTSKLIQITSVSGYSIKITPNHKMLIKRKNKKMILQAKSILKSDKIATIGSLNIERTNNPKIKDFVIENKLEIDNYKFDSNLSYFIGAMLGDGYSGAETVNGKIKYKGSATIVGVDKNIFDKVKKLSKNHNLNFRESIMPSGTPQLVLSKHKWFREFLVRCGVEKGKNKHISNKLMKMKLENISWLLKGLFDTDGYVQKGRCVGFSNISEKLVKQIQKILLRFGIVVRIRKRKGGSMQINEKEYKTVPQYELLITQKKSIIDFYLNIGFHLPRKQDTLVDLVGRILSNINYLSCEKCGYKIYRDMFSGRNKYQKRWGITKLKVIKLLGEKGELGSRQIRDLINEEPKKKDSRLNHHYELIQKRKQGRYEWLWKLNSIGDWIYKNILKSNKNIILFFKNRQCPLCHGSLEWFIKKGWRSDDYDGDIFWDIIREIKEVGVEKEVFDIVLPNIPKNDHMFVANGFIVHNSAGLDLPAFRAVIKDLKRFGPRGMNFIPVLEYLQMSGRAGRPKFDDYGEAICLAGTEAEKEVVTERYLNGEPEEIFSKLAVEPVLRTYLLSLIASNFVNTREQINTFFEKTFWAYQFEDMKKLEGIIEKMLMLLEEWEFLISSKEEFTSADQLGNDSYRATKLGKRVAELYLDPYTAHHLINGIKNAMRIKGFDLSLLQLISHTLEMRPLLSIRSKEWDDIQDILLRHEDKMLMDEPSLYEDDYDEFMKSVKTALFFQDWINEHNEDALLEHYGIRPGEIRIKLSLADWLLYGMEELTRIMEFRDLLKDVSRLRYRVKYGVKEELMTLVRLKGIGRVRARMLFRNGIRDIKGLKNVDIGKLRQLVGNKTAENIKKELDQEILGVKKGTRKGQLSVQKFS